MRKRREFTNEFKLEAVKLAERGDVPVAQVARDLGLHETVLRRWMSGIGQRPDGTRLTPGRARGADPAAPGDTSGSPRSGTS